MLPPKLESYIELVESYDVFVFDIYGVLHNGLTLYNQTVQFIRHLRLLDKKILFLSNNPRPSSISVQSLVQKGFNLEKGEMIFTSGDFFQLCYRNNFHNMFFPKRKIYNLGEEYNSDLLLGLDVDKANDIATADYVILSIFTDTENELSKWDRELKIAVKKDIPVICVNPDIMAPYGDRVRYTPGTFAKKYHDLGGQVHYFGKPYQDIYKYLLDPILSEGKLHKNRVLAIGDSLETDIKGAVAYGIHSLLLLSGVHAKNHLNSTENLKEIFIESGVKPTFLMNQPKFDLDN